MLEVGVLMDKCPRNHRMDFLETRRAPWLPETSCGERVADFDSDEVLMLAMT